MKVEGTVFKTSGNIVFPEEKEGSFHIGRSEALDKMDKFIQKGILNNAMADLIEQSKQFKPPEGKK